MPGAYAVSTLLWTGAADAVLSPDGTLLYVSRRAGFIDVFDVATHQKIDSWSIGRQPGALSVSEDGSFLLVVEHQPLSGKSTLYKVDTQTGEKKTFSKDGSAFYDIEVVDADTALITGGQPTATTFNPLTGAFGSTDYRSSSKSSLTEDDHYTVLAVPNISNGPLHLFDDRQNRFVADGDTYDGGGSGANYGRQSISEEARLVVQLNANSNIRVYDLNLDFQKYVYLGPGDVSGLAFDEAGKYLYAHISQGEIRKYNVSTWALVETFDVLATDGSTYGYGNQVLLAQGGRYIAILDYLTSNVQLVDTTMRGETLVGTAGPDLLNGLGGNDLLDGKAGNDVLEGGTGADETRGGPGDDVHIVADGGDKVVESADGGTDEIRTTLASYSLAGIQVEKLTGLGAGAHTLTGNGLANLIDGGEGADSMAGDAGDDTFAVDNAGDTVVEHSGGGTDTVRTNLGYTLPDHVENLVLTGGAAVNGTGNSLSNRLTGNAAANVLTGGGGNDTIDGGAGADTMKGGAGDDIYFVDRFTLSTATPDDLVVEAAAAGTDSVNSSVAYVLAANVENLILTGTAGIAGTGNALANRLGGNEGANRLDGGAGADTMNGAGGNDIYVVEAAGDTVVEGASGGFDTVESSVSYSLADHVENLVLTGGGAVDGTGNSVSNRLTGNAAANILSGGGGNDTIDGGAGADTMKGGAGNDIYFVDRFTLSTATPDDLVVEAAAAGTDSVNSSVAYVLAANVENLVLIGTGGIAGTGNALANSLGGNDGANRLDGGAGADTMNGAGGNDIYVVEAAGDTVVEGASGGFDTVESSVSHTLADHVENLVLTGGGAVDGTGNSLSNRLTGNAAANVLTGGGGNDILRAGGEADTLNGDAGLDTLDGGTGADIMSGGADHDTYMVDTAGDQVIENGSCGTDTVQSSVGFTLPTHVEKLVLTGTSSIEGRGNSGANTITGNSGGNFLNGGSGNDVIDAGAGNDRILGGAGNDSLKGGAGLDRFEFTAALGATNVDKILDFSVADDSVYLLRSLFTRAGASGALAASAFHQGTAAADASDRIVYDQATGRIFYDSDGTGGAAAILFATVTPGTALTSADFMVYG